MAAVEERDLASKEELRRQEKRLAEFVSLPAASFEKDWKRIAEFFGDNIRPDYKSPEGYCAAVRKIRQCWDWKVAGYKRLLTLGNATLNSILAPIDGEVGELPSYGVTADIGGNGLAVRVRDGLDQIVYTFIRCLPRLALCNNERCRKPFVKASSREAYCSPECKRSAGRAYRLRWYYSPKGQRWFRRKRSHAKAA